MPDSGYKTYSLSQSLSNLELRRVEAAERVAVEHVVLPGGGVVLQALVADDLDGQTHADAAQQILFGDAVVNDAPVRADAEGGRARELLVAQHLDLVVAGMLVEEEGVGVARRARRVVVVAAHLEELERPESPAAFGVGDARGDLLLVAARHVSDLLPLVEEHALHLLAVVRAAEPHLDAEHGDVLVNGRVVPDEADGQTPALHDVDLLLAPVFGYGLVGRVGGDAELAISEYRGKQE